MLYYGSLWSDHVWAFLPALSWLIATLCMIQCCACFQNYPRPCILLFWYIFERSSAAFASLALVYSLQLWCAEKRTRILSVDCSHMMQIILFSTILILIASTVAQGTTNATFLAEEIASLSPCGVSKPYQRSFPIWTVYWQNFKLNCLETNIPIVGCSLLNTTCQCSSQRLVTLTSACLLKNCTFLESLGMSFLL